MAKNQIVNAIHKMNGHIDNMLGLSDSVEKRREELMKLNKAELVELVLKSTTVQSVKIEDIAKLILEDPDCAWLDWNTIAEAICSKVNGAKTTHKSLASYASKNPREKGWDVVARKSQKERTNELMKGLI